MILLIGLILGILVGLILNIPIPSAYTVYIAVLIISALNSLVSIIADILENVYQNKYSLLGFLGNTLISAALAALGAQLKIPLDYVVYFGLGAQMYRHLHRIWHQLSVLAEQRENRTNPKK